MLPMVSADAPQVYASALKTMLVKERSHIVLNGRVFLLGNTRTIARIAGAPRFRGEIWGARHVQNGWNFRANCRPGVSA